MEKELIVKFNNAGIDIESVLNRFMGNEQLLNTFLAKFIQTTDFEKLRQQVSNLDWENAYVTAHHLKGQCANFSFTEVFNLLSEQLEALRNEDYDKVTSLIPPIFIEKQKVIQVVESYLAHKL